MIGALGEKGWQKTMSMKNKKALPDDELDKVSGGEGDSPFISGDRLVQYRCNITYGGRLQTQVGCGRIFTEKVGLEQCPFCGSKNIEELKRWAPE